jgi:hypothetical protein
LVIIKKIYSGLFLIVCHISLRYESASSKKKSDDKHVIIILPNVAMEGTGLPSHLKSFCNLKKQF